MKQKKFLFSLFFLFGCFFNQPTEQEAKAAMQDYLQSIMQTGFQEGLESDETGLGGIFGAALLGDTTFVLHNFELLGCESKSSKVAYCEVYIDYELVSRNPDASMLSLFTLFGAQTRMNGTENVKFIRLDNKWVASQ